MSERQAASEAPTGRSAIEQCQALRIQLLRRRRALSEAEVSTASSLIISRLAGDRRVRRAARAGPIGLYWPVRGEPDVRPLPTAARTSPDGSGVRLDAPYGVTLPGHPAARPRLLHWDAAATLASAWAALRYPPDGTTEVAPRDHGVILVPGVAFDPSGNRLGNGGGWYDRLLAGLGATTGDRPGDDTPLLVGVAHEFQLVERLEAQPWDVPMDLIATPSQLIGA